MIIFISDPIVINPLLGLMGFDLSNLVASCTLLNSLVSVKSTYDAIPTRPKRSSRKLCRVSGYHKLTFLLVCTYVHERTDTFERTNKALGALPWQEELQHRIRTTISQPGPKKYAYQ